MRRALLAAILAAAALGAHARTPKAPAPSHQFGVIGHSFAASADDALLRQSLQDTSDPGLAFVVAIGIKHAGEPCSDAVYQARRDLFDDAARPLIVVPAASDWSECRTPNGRSAAAERLARVRELFFGEPNSLGQKKLALTRLSSTPKFRSFAENAQWEVGKVLYATVNLSSDNNHYRLDAGRNSEFEDRLVANRAWLHRLATQAQRKKFDAIVLFSEADIGILSSARAHANVRQDGFADVRRQVTAIAMKFGGKVLLVDSAPTLPGGEPAIAWRGNLGHVSLGEAAKEVRVTPGQPTLFTLRNAAESAPEKQNGGQAPVR
jgi:hypothetical protein